MAEDDRPVDRKAAQAVDDVQIAVADPGRRGADQHLAAPRLIDLDLFEGQRPCTLRNTAASIAIVYLPRIGPTGGRLGRQRGAEKDRTCVWRIRPFWKMLQAEHSRRFRFGRFTSANFHSARSRVRKGTLYLLRSAWHSQRYAE